MSYQRIGGISRYAKSHNWQLVIHDRLGGLSPFGEGLSPAFGEGLSPGKAGHDGRKIPYDGALVTLRQDKSVFDVAKALCEANIPVVDLTIQHPDQPLPRVISDHFEIGKIAGTHFKERGFTNIAWFSSGWTFVHQMRYSGLASEFVGEQDPDQEIIPGQNGAPQVIVSDNEEEIKQALSALPRPAAVLAYDEADAVKILNLAISIGRSVPDDIAILSIGDDPLITDNQQVPISCVRQNLSRGGFAAAALLDRLMTKIDKHAPFVPEDYKPVLIKPEGITVRTSTDTLSDDNPLVRTALLYIRDNLEKSFGIDEIAEKLKVSRCTLDRICRTHLGHPLGSEILIRRIAKAKQLLRETDLGIAEIAYRTGFCSPAYFTLKFRNATGLTPGRWRTSRTSQAAT